MQISKVSDKNVYVTLGYFRDAGGYRWIFSQRNIQLSGSALDLLELTPIYNYESTLKLSRCTPRTLGLRGLSTYSTVVEKAREAGLTLCPPEVALALRIQWTRHQPPFDRVYVAMDELHCRYYGDSGIFVLDRGLARFWLDTCPGHRDFTMDENNSFFFVSS